MKKIVHLILAVALSGMAIAEVKEPCGSAPGGGGGGGGGDGLGSGDPNEMCGPIGVGNPDTQRFVKPGEPMTYTVYFENVSTATAAAADVYVTNPLSEWLDWSTFEMGEVAFNNQTDLGLIGKNHGSCDTTLNGTNFLVRTELGGGKDGKDTIAQRGVVRWHLRIVDPTTDTGNPKDILAGFLQPNDDTHRGEGHLTYRIKVRDDAPANVVITNSASIVFDYNDPIETDPAWWNTVGQIADIAIEGEGVDFVVTNLSLVVGAPYGEALSTVPTTGKPGYTFAGWYTGPNGTGRHITAESLVEEGDDGLYAYWTANEYVVVFNANGGEGEMAIQTNTYDIASCLASNKFTNIGYVFAGWATQEDGEVVYGDGAVVSNLTTEADSVVDLYAIWGGWKIDFAATDIAVDEGSNIVLRVSGGNAEKASSVQVYVAYNTAAAADLDLKTATVADGDAAVSSKPPYQTNLKVPLTLSWAAGEIGEKTITIPVKADALLEGEEFFTLQLVDARGMDLGENGICTVTVKDEQWPDGMSNDEATERGLALMPVGATPVYMSFDGGETQTLVGYFTKADKKGNVTAKPLPGYVFVAWVYDSNGNIYSTKATITEKLRKSKKVHPVFEPAAYLRALVADPATGTAKGQGLYAIGKAVTLTAAAKKGYAFTGWRAGTGNGEQGTGNGVISLATSLKVANGDATTTYVASFKKESELARPVLTLADAHGTTSSDAATGNDRTLSVGVSYPATLAVEGESNVSITKVTGLPTGLKYKGGKITGVPTKAGKFTASVTVALASNKKKTWVCKVPFTVVALPEWARGNFSGVVTAGEEAAATMTVGTTGKISGKFSLGGTNWTFSASSFAKDSVVTGDVVRFVAAMTATGTWKDKSGKKTVTRTVKLPMGFSLVADPGTSAIASTTENGYFGTDDTETEEDESGTVEFRRDAGVSAAKGGDPAGGSVSLSVALGQAAAGKAVKATAKLSKGYALLGWYLVESGETNLVSQALSYSVKMSGSDVFLVAAFAKEGELARPVVTWSDPYLTVEVDAATAPAATNYVGVSYPAALSVTGDAKVSISKVTGLPTGLSYKGGKITGVPTKAGTFTPVVTVALSTNAKKTWAYKFPMVIVALPAYARGSFTGGVMPGGGEAAVGLATVSVGSTGKISGKFYEGGTNWTLSAASYGLYEDDAFTCSNLVAKYSWNEKRGKKTVQMSAVRTFSLLVEEASNGDTMLGCATAEEVVAEGDGASLMAWQNLWGSKYKAIGSALFSTSAKVQYKTWPSVAAEGLGEYDSLSMKVTTAGAVTATYRYFRGTFDAKGAPQYATYTCSTTLVPTTSADVGAEAFAGVAPVFLPPVASTGFPGCYAEVHYPFVGREVPVPTKE